MTNILLQKTNFVSVHPFRTIKSNVNDIICFSCELSDTLNLKNDLKNDLIVELWTNLSGRYHGYELTKKESNVIKKTIETNTSNTIQEIKETTIYSIDFKIKNTGFFKATFRYRFANTNYWIWHISSEEKDFTSIHIDPEYINKSIVYNAFIRFFGQKNISSDGTIKFGESGTFDDLKKRIREIKDLGVDILYLNPIHPIGEMFRNYNPHDQYPKYLQPGCPYSIKDYKSIDPELGVDIDHSQGPHASLSSPLKEFKELVDEAHKNKIKVYMDLVFNHTSHDFVLQRLHPEWFLYKENIKSLEEAYIYPNELTSGKPWGDPAHTMCPFDHGYWWEDAAQLNWEYMIPKASNNPPKNPTLKEMYAYFKSIPKYWIKHVGIDGFRCDVAYRIPKDFWKECINESREFAKNLKKRRKNTSLSGDVVFIAESYVDDVSELFECGFTSVYGDYSQKLYSPLTLKGYLDYMYNISGCFFPENSKFFIFPECHDFHRTIKKIVGNNDDSVLSERANKSRWLITATLPGIPMIFNGFEKLEWQPVNLFSYSLIDWESDKDLKEFITKVNKIRNNNVALQKGKYTFVNSNQGLNENTQLFSFIRSFENSNFLICVNMDIKNSATATIYLNDLNIDFSKKFILKDHLTGKSFERISNELLIVLEPGDGHIFEIIQK